MDDFTAQELGLMHDLINVAWQAGVVKSPQMAQGVEQLRAKVLAKLKPIPENSKKIPDTDVKG